MSLFHTILHVAKVIRSPQYIFFVNGIKISLKYTAFPCVPPFIFEAEAPLFAVSLALTVAVYSVPCLGANAVFIWLPAVKHVAKAKNPPEAWRRGTKEEPRCKKTHRKTECCPADISSLSSILLSLILLACMSGQ